jgi:hypothetical protein
LRKFLKQKQDKKEELKRKEELLAEAMEKQMKELQK